MTVIAMSIAMILYSWGTAAGGLKSWPYIISNLAVAFLVLSLAKRAGLTDREVGTTRESLGPGVRIGGGIGLFLFLIIIGGALLVSQVFPDSGGQLQTPSGFPESATEVLFETLLRVPIGTALAEETLFRGALLALWVRDRGPRDALIGSSVAFALWHIVPTIVNERANGAGATRIVIFVLGSVLLTFFAGMLFVYLRRRTKGILGPTLVHAAFNSSLIAAGYIASWWIN